MAENEKQKAGIDEKSKHIDFLEDKLMQSERERTKNGDKIRKLLEDKESLITALAEQAEEVRMAKQRAVQAENKRDLVLEDCNRCIGEVKAKNRKLADRIDELEDMLRDKDEELKNMGDELQNEYIYQGKGVVIGIDRYVRY